MSHVQAKEQPIYLKDVPLREIVLVCLGFGLVRAWSSLDGSPTLFLFASSDAFAFIESTNLLESFCHVVTLIAVATLAFVDRFPRRLLAVIGGLTLFLGTVLIQSYVNGIVGPYPAVHVAKVLIAGSAVLSILWVERLCRLSPRTILGCVAASYALSYSLALLCTLLPAPAIVFLQSAYPLLSAALFLHVDRTARGSQPLVDIVGTAAPADSNRAVCLPGLDSSGYPKDGSRIAQLRSLPYKSLLGVGIFGAIILLANCFSEVKSSQPDELSSLVVGLCTALLFIVFAFLYPKDINLGIAFRLLLPIIVVCTFVVFFIEEDQQPYESVCIGCGWTMYILTSWVMWCQVAMRSSAPKPTVLALGLLVFALFSMSVTILSPIVVQSGANRMVVVAAICVVAILTSLYLLDENSLNPRSGPIRTAAHSGSSNGSGIADFVDAADNPASDRIPSTTIPASYLDIDDLKSCRYCTDMAAGKYGLTERESHIALLTLQGRDTSQIAAELTITSATLRTHLRNLYKKTGVHSKQELIALLRSFHQ